MKTADLGIEELQKCVDTLIVIPNQNLFRLANDKTTFADAFAMAYGEDGVQPVVADTDRFAIWSQGFGSWGGADSDGNAAAFDRSTGGLLVGADGLAGDWRIGVVGGYSRTSFDADDRHSSGDSDNYHLGLYGGTKWGAIAFRTGTAYTWHRISTSRSVAFQGFADSLSADYDAATAQAFGELVYKTDAEPFAFEPFANLAYVNLHTDGFAESGGAAALTSSSSTSDATFTTLGVRASTDIILGGVAATARGMPSRPWLFWRPVSGSFGSGSAAPGPGLSEEKFGAPLRIGTSAAGGWVADSRRPCAEKR